MEKTEPSQAEKKPPRKAKILWKKLRNLLIHKKGYVNEEIRNFKSEIPQNRFIDKIEYIISPSLRISIKVEGNIGFDKEYFFSLKKEDQSHVENTNSKTSDLKNDIKHIKEKNFKEKRPIIEIDKTGLVLWKAEEILANYVYENFIKKSDQSLISKNNLKILEIGAGRSSLAALTIAKYLKTNKREGIIHLTDGNPECIPILNQNIVANNLRNMNKKNISPTRVEAFPLLFGDYSEIKENYDLILASDVLFFEKFHDDLIGLIRHCVDINKDARVVMVNKERGGSQDRFLNKIGKYEDLQVSRPEPVGKEKLYYVIKITG